MTDLNIIELQRLLIILIFEDLPRFKKLYATFIAIQSIMK